MTYINSIYAAVLTFPFIAAFLTFPYALHEYHKYGSVSKYRTLIVFSFILYMITAYFMVILPLPDRETTIGNLWQDHLNLIPFRQISLYWSGKTLSWASLYTYMKSMALWQLLFNVLLTVPFGIYLRYYFKKSLKITIVCTFLLSLFYELTQLSALYGIYPGPYRLADVEDLICNTLGGVIGYQIAYVFMVILPSRDEIDEHCRTEGKKVSGKRRFVAALFDYFCSMIVFTFICGMLRVIYPGFNKYLINSAIYNWSFFCLFSVIQVLLTKGTTLGHAICRMVIVSEDGSRAPTGRLIMRYVYIWLFTELPLIMVSALTDSYAHVINDFVIIALIILSRAYFYMYFFREFIRRGNRLMPHDKLSHTIYMSTNA